jgi:pimeloyl-ACP methyl ester carboxylesterase
VKPVAGVVHRDVELDGVRLHVAEAGAGRTLVLLHGWPQHWWCWRHLIPRLSRERRVLAPDLRGFGWSQAPSGDYAKATFAADVLRLIDAAGLERVDIVGHDWGGYTAMLLALDHPERIERAVALDIAPPWRQSSAPRPRHLALPLLGSYMALLATPVAGPGVLTAAPHFVRTLLRAGSGPGMRWRQEDLDVYADVLRDPARAQASSACYRTFLTRELPATVRRGDRSDELEVPTLLVMGEASAIRRFVDPQSGPNLTVETVAGAGHFLPEEAPEQVGRLIEEWLR